MSCELRNQLHAPLIPILRHALALAPLPRAGIALDLACGPGDKAALLAEALGPGVRLVGVDIDPAVIQEQRTKNKEQNTQEPRTKNQEPGDATLSPCLL